MEEREKGLQGQHRQLLEGMEGRGQQGQSKGQQSANQPKIVPPQGGSGTAPPQSQNKPKEVGANHVARQE